MGNFFRRLRVPLAVMAMAVGSLPLFRDTLLAQEQLSPTAPAAGNSTTPAVLLTVGSLSKLQQDVSYLSAVVGQPNVGNTFAGMSGMFTQGLTPTEPIGVMVTLVNGAPEPIIMVPTTDVKILLGGVEQFTGPYDEQADGTLALSINGQIVFIKQVGNWAIVARDNNLLSLAPADPAAAFVGMGNNYDLAFRLKLQQIPAPIRGMIVGQLRQGFEQAMAQQSGQGEAGRAYAENTMDQLVTFINETDELFFGLNIDPSGKLIALDTTFTAVEGSSMAKLYGDQHSISSRFSGVMRPEAASFIHAATSISPEMIDHAKDTIQGSIAMLKNAIKQQGDLPAAQQADVDALINRIAALAIDSVSEGKSDAGALLLADEDRLQFVFGAFLSDGNEAAQIVKDLAAKVQGIPDGPRFQFDRDTYGDVKMHVIEADIPEGEDEVRKVFGPTLKVHIGTAPKAVYIALGDPSMPLLKELIDSGSQDTGGERPLSQGQIKMLPILQYVKSIESNPVIDSMIDALGRSADPGQVSFVGDSIPNGQQSRVRIGEGVLQAIGAAIQAGQSQNAAAAF